MSQHATSDPNFFPNHPRRPAATPPPPPAHPLRTEAADIKRWRQYLADERAEAAVYRDLAQNRSGEEREILLALAEAEGRHEAHWLQLLGDQAGRPRPASLRSQLLGFLARHFGSVFVLALAQRAESRSPYATDPRPRRPWSPTNRSMRKWSAGSPPGAATGWPARSARPFSGPTTDWSATCPWSWAWPPPAWAVPWSCSAVSPGCWPGRCPWVPANSFPCARSANSWPRPVPTQITLAAAPSLDIEHNELLLVYLARGMSRGSCRAPRRGADGPARLRLRSQPFPAAGGAGNPGRA